MSKSKKKEDLSATEMVDSQPVYAYLKYQDILSLQGQILTIIDASIADNQQRKALKDLIKQTIWFRWAENLQRTDPEMPVGMPYDD